MTEAEKILWSKIRKKQLGDFQFYRQKIFGNYIVDFYCHKAKLVIEIDGSQHYTNEGIVMDKVRDEFFENIGIKVLRFSNNEVFSDLNNVVNFIYEYLNSIPSYSE